MSQIETDFRLIDDMLKLLAPSYLDARDLLSREIKFNSTGYFMYDEVQELVAFFLVGYEVPCRLDDEIPVYLGLSACRELNKHRGLTARLYRQFNSDAESWGQERSQQIRVWATTAHPLIWALSRRFWDMEWPRDDGSYSIAAAQLAWKLRRQLPEAYQSSDHPFVFRAAALGTRYSISELERCELARVKRQVRIFTELHIDERRGDRLLMLGKLRTQSIAVQDTDER